MNLLKDVLAGRVPLPMLPRVIIDLLALLRREDLNLNDLVPLVERDAVLASRLLRLANSAFFAGRRGVDSVRTAVMTVGCQPLSTLLVACGAQSVFIDVPGVNLRRFWERSQQTATAARQLARRLGLDADAAHAAGLLLAVGHLIACRAEPERAVQAFPGLALPWGETLAAREQAAFGTTHAALSALWADHIGMPEPVAAALREVYAEPGAAVPPLSLALRLATALAGCADAGGTAGVLDQAGTGALLERLGLPTYAQDGAAAEDLALLADAATV